MHSSSLLFINKKLGATHQVIELIYYFIAWKPLSTWIFSPVTPLEKSLNK